jgi:hypothetical protein
MAGRTGHLNVRAGNADEGTGPLLVPEGGLTLEGDLDKTIRYMIPRTQCCRSLPWCQPSSW